MTTQNDDVITFNKKKAELLKEVYLSLNSIEVHIEQLTEMETHLETQPDGCVISVEHEVVKTNLYIDTVSMTQEEAADKYGFDEKQREQLFELLSDKNKEMWKTLLPGLYRIACRSTYADVLTICVTRSNLNFLNKLAVVSNYAYV